MTSPAQPAIVLEIGTNDRLQLRVAGKRVDIASRKARAALGYLVLNETQSVRREHLVGLLWSETDEEKARGSLRHCIKEIRLALRGTGFDGLQLDGQEIGFDPDLVRVDIWDICEQAKRGEVHPSLIETSMVTDDILKDVETVDPVFQTWLLTKRQSLNQRLIRHFEDALQTIAIADRRGEAIARAILNLDPTHEEACRQLMRSRAHHGDIGGAVKIYTALWELLDKDYDIEPTEQTQTLFAELKAALPLTAGPDKVGAEANPVAPLSLTTPAARRATTTKIVLSIAPFEVSGIAPERRYLVLGFRGELIAYLARFREWIVREQTSTGMREGLEPEEYLLQAQTMPVKDGARLVLSLRECASDAYLWGNGIDLRNVDWGEAQQGIVRRIAAALNIHVSAGRQAQVGPRPMSDLSAYDMWLRGQTEQVTHEPAGLERAEKLYRDIIQRHPRFAPAYSSLAQLQNVVHFVYPGRFRSRQTTLEALRFGSEAVRLDPMDSRSQLCLGWAFAMSDLHDQAGVHHKLAVELNESDPWTLVSAALGFAFRGEHDTSRELSDLAAQLSVSPTGTHWRYQAMISYLNGDFETCLHAAVQAELSIQNVLVWKAASLVQLGRKAEAAEAVDKFYQAVAKRWNGAGQPADRKQMTRWFLHAFPIKDEAIWVRLRDDFESAGAPVDGIEFNDWQVPRAYAHIRIE